MPLPTELTLGWRVTAAEDPRYWLRAAPRAGEQQAADLVRVPSHAMATHCAIVAQSGSGKSFFLGRLVEELLLNTRARCLVLDPNADFRRVHEVADASLWTDASYDPEARFGYLPHEAMRDEFADAWSAVTKQIFLGPKEDPFESPVVPLRVGWLSLSPDSLATAFDPFTRTAFHHCHAFTRAVAKVANLCARARSENWPGFQTREERLRDDPLEAAEAVWRGVVSARERRDYGPLGGRPFVGTWNPEGVARVGILNHFGIVTGDVAGRTEQVQSALVRLLGEVTTATRYLTEDIALFYFAKAREYQQIGIVVGGWQRPVTTDARLSVIDLPSAGDRRSGLLATEAIVTAEWERARTEWAEALAGPAGEDTRVPTFVIVDEAHNLIPSEPRDEAETLVRERFRSIAAEGRKYGLFLIAATQRPDKLDRLVLSECENRALMKIGSEAVLTITRTALALEDVPARILGKCLGFALGRVLLVGRWAEEGPQLLYTAARRTREGGRNLRREHWASGPDLSDG